MGRLFPSKFETSNDVFSKVFIIFQTLSAATFSCFASLVAPGVALPGTLSIHAEEIYWEAADESDEFQKVNPSLLRYVDGCPGKWSFHEIRAIYSRKYLLQNTALEIFLANRTSIMFNFIDNQTVRKIVTSLPRVGIGTGYGLPQVILP